MSTRSTAANPRANNPQDGGQESIGAVTSDSLAAESIKADGGFSENDNANVMSVKGSNSTLNTTDTSGATTLHAAADGATREKQDAMSQGSDEKGVTGLKYPEAAGQPSFDGAHSQEGYTGGPSNASSGSQTTAGGTVAGASGDSFADGGAGTAGDSIDTSKISSGSTAAQQGSSQAGATASSSGASDNSSGNIGGSSGSGNASGGNSGSDNTSSGNTASATSGSGNTSGGNSAADTAPNYAATVSGAIHSEGQFKPKGENLTEGDIPQTKTFTGDVGGQHDPGRVAEQGFQKVSAENAASAGQPKYEGSGQDSGTTDNKFDVLSSERA